MKKFLFSILCIMAYAVSVAQSSVAFADTTSAMSSVSQVDTVHVQPVMANAEEFKAGETHLLRTEDEGEFVVYNGVAYKVGDIADVAFNSSRYMDDEDYISYKESKIDAIVKVVAFSVAFLIPCITIIVALIILMVFFMKKNSAKNQIISKAIDCNYQLPDAFYTGNFSQGGVTADGGMAYAPEDNNNLKMFVVRVVPEASRDPKMFVSAMTLIAVGFAILLFFSFNHEIGVGFLCGGIPLFLGIGRMIAYYYVPGAYKQRNFRKSQGNQGDNRFESQAPNVNANTYWQQPAPQNFAHMEGEYRHGSNQQKFNGPCPPPTPSDSSNQGNIQ